MATVTRKTVTVLFSDIVESTALGEALDPEQMRALTARYFDEMRTIIERHGGVVEKYIGDAVMAVFGIPSLHEDDALRAVRAAVEMHGALAALNDDLGRHISIRTGANTGEVVTGDGPTLVTGDAVNVAARLEQAAEPGAIVIGTSTYTLVRDAVRAEALGELELRGKSQPVGAWRVTEVLPDTLGRARRFDAELVGREDDVTLLKRAYARAVAQESCHLFTVLGAAGVGKSRLARELLEQVSGGAQTLLGRCLAYGEGITFWPLRDMLNAVPDLRAHLDDAEATAVEAAIGTAGAPAIREETFRAVRRLVESLARERPLILAVDDLHWAEPTFLDLIEHIVDNVVEAPVLVLALARPELLEERPHWGGGKVNATTILLEPLDAEQSECLVDNLAGESLPDEVRRSITQVAEGNPLFLEELVAAAMDDPETLGIPGSIQALLAARLERLPARQREVATAAAVVGRFFSDRLVAMLVGADVDGELAELERKHLIRRQRVPFGDGSGYRFRHVLIRDAAYESLAKSRRLELHSNVATTLEQSDDDAIELVGLHLEQAARYAAELGVPDAGLARRAGAALSSAAERAFGRSDMPATRSLAERALQLDPGIPLDVRRALGIAYWNLGEPAAAIDVLREVEGGAEQKGERRALWAARLDRLAFEVVIGAAGHDELVEASHRAIELFEELDDASGLARAWRGLAVVELQRLRYAGAALLAERGRAFAARVNAVHELMRLADVLGTSLLQGPSPIDEAFTRSVRLAAEETSLGGRANVLCSLAVLHALAGRGDEAGAAAGDAAAIFAELGLPLLSSAAAEVHGEVELILGRPEAAEERFRVALAARGDARREEALVARLAASLVAQARESEASESLEQIDDGARGPRFFVVSAAVRLATGDVETAARHSTHAERLLEHTEATLLRIEAAAVAARAHDAAGDGAAAAAASGRAAAHAASKGVSASPAWVSALPAVQTAG
ncbi:MAG: AAA family ATPase [Gaiellaceae bacterium]